MDPKDALLTGLALLLLLQTARLIWRSRAPGLRLHFKKQRASRAERDAVELLEDLGFRVEASQVGTKWPVECDGAVLYADLRADLVVSREGRQYVAEVKSGAQATRIETRATRRQLLEYRLAYDVDGVLLVDMASRRVREVRFPALSGRRGEPASVWVWAVVAAVAIAAIGSALR